jgi:hypothetical protein
MYAGLIIPKLYQGRVFLPTDRRARVDKGCWTYYTYHVHSSPNLPLLASVNSSAIPCAQRLPPRSIVLRRMLSEGTTVAPLRWGRAHPM